MREGINAGNAESKRAERRVFLVEKLLDLDA
jgi:hypothetical protein